ncbi:MAG: glycosyltransferase [Pseudomonadota bacterium]
MLAITSHADTLNSVRPEAELFIGLANAGVEMSVMTESDSPYADNMRAAGIEILDYDITKKLARRSVRALRQCFKAKRFDIVYAFNNKAICNAAFAAIGLPLVLLTYRGQTGNISRSDPGAYLTHLHPRVDGIICVAKAVEVQLAKEVGSRKTLHTVYKGHDLSWYQDAPTTRSSIGLNDDQFVIGCVANNRPRKGVRYLLQACATLKDIPTLHLLLIGSDMDERTLGQQVAQLGMTARVSLLGRREDATALIQCCDVAVLPAIRREGLPKSVIEAMVYAVAPVVTDTVGYAELVEVGNSGLVVPPADASALASALRRLHDDPEARASFAAAARERIHREFNVHQTVAGTLAVFQSHLQK